MFLPPEGMPGVGDGLTGKDGWTYLPPEIIRSGGALAEAAGAKLTTFSEAAGAKLTTFGEAAGAELTTFSEAATGLATTVTGTKPIILALGRFIPATVLAPGFFVGLGACAAGAGEVAGNFVSDSGAGFATAGFVGCGRFFTSGVAGFKPVIVTLCRLISVTASPGATFVGLVAGATWGNGATRDCMVDSGFCSWMTGSAGGGTFFTSGDCMIDSGFGSGFNGLAGGRTFFASGVVEDGTLAVGLAGGGTFFTSSVVEGNTLAAVFWGRTIGVASGNDAAGFGAGKLLGSSMASSSCQACTTG
jgi:hypothetical protein